MNGLEDLYRSVIIEHSRDPSHQRAVDEPTHEAHAHNTLCGDTITVVVRVGDDDVIEGISFDSRGCAISTASASLMADDIEGRTTADAVARVEEIREMAVSGEFDAIDGEVAALAGIVQYPMRVKCATLSWHALRDALESPISR